MTNGTQYRELRIAPVMTGGTSLAVWMGGVTAEIYRLVTSQPSAADGASMYERLLEFTRSTPRIDVVTGTSAGGLNGSLIAAAWARGLSVESFLETRKTWLDLADINKLLRDPNEANPPSLLKGDDYFRERLSRVLDGWARETEVSDTSERPPDRPIDLLITVTTITPEPIYNEDDFGQPLGEATHASHIRFLTDDFWTEHWPDRLATASRTSASIPGVFEPSYLRVGGKRSSTHPTVDLAEVSAFDKSHWAVDGGVVVNLPLTEAIDRIFDQRAEGSLRRVILYVKPTPTVPKAFEGDDQKKVPSIFDSVATAVLAPRAEGISADLDVIRQHNLAVSRQEAARVDLTWNPNRLSISERAEGLFEAFKTIHTVNSVSSMMDKAASPLLAGAQGRWPDIETAIRKGRVSWLPDDTDSLGTAESVWSWGISPLDNAIGVVLQLIGAALDLTAQTSDETERLADIRRSMHGLHDQLRGLRAIDDAYWKFATIKLSAIMSAAADASRSDADGWYPAVEQWAEEAYAHWPNIDAPEVADWGDELEDIATHARDDRDTAIAQLRGTASDSRGSTVDGPWILRRLRTLALGIATHTQHATPHVEAICSAAGFEAGEFEVPSDSASASEPVRIWHQYQQITHPDVTECLLRLLRLYVVDLTLGGGRTTNSQYLEVMQVSWDASSPLDPTRLPQEKLAGTELGRLGAFLKPSWRANDWFWGRLDGSAQLLLLLLDPVRLRQLGHGWDEVVDFVAELATPGDDPHLTAAWAEREAEVREELKFLDPDSDAHVPSRLPKTADALAFALHTSIAAVELGHVDDAIERSKARGAVEGDEGYFQRLYRRAPKVDGRPRPEDVGALVRSMRIGQETATDELRGDMLAQSVSQSLAVATKGLAGDHSGMGWLARVLRPVQTSVLYGHSFVRLATTGSRLAQALTALALMASAAILALAMTGNSIGPVWTTAAAAAFTAALIFMAIRSGVWSIAPAALLFLVAGLALVGNELDDVIADSPTTGTQPIQSGDTVEVAGGAIVVSDTSGQERTIEVEAAQITFDDADGAVLIDAADGQPLESSQSILVAGGEVSVYTEGEELADFDNLRDATITFREDSSVRFVQQPDDTTATGWKRYGFTDGWEYSDPIAVIVLRALVVVWFAVLVWRTVRNLRGGHGRVTVASWLALAVVGSLTVTMSPWLFERVLTGDGESGVRGWIIDAAAFMETHSFVVVLSVLMLIGLIIGLAWDKTGRKLFTRARLWVKIKVEDAFS